jgi:hypothetical protein
VSLRARIVTLVAAFLLVAGGAIFVVVQFLVGQAPPVENYASYAKNGQVNVTLQTSPQTTVTDHPDWVTYFIKNPQSGQWVHTTYFAVPANTRVNVTIEAYDGCTPLRNPYFGHVTGTIGDVEYVNGKAVSDLDSWSGCTVQHTFAIPGLGLNVPVASPTTVDENNNLCSSSPCSSGPHEVVRFSFMTPAKGGTFRWQCFVPCGGGYIDGNGGPMATLGYMMGQMRVVTS